jgi:IPT/TIG domain
MIRERRLDMNQLRRASPTRALAAALLCALFGGACSSGNGSSGGDSGTDTKSPSDGGHGTSDTSVGPDGVPPHEGGVGDTGPAPIAGLRVFFSDLESGPNTGGQDGEGAFVTLYGNGFGASQGTSTVTVGGGAADNYPIWTNTKITFQVGAAARTGDMIVHVVSKGDSNALPFTVRAGNIFFVSSKGSDGAPGSFASPWATIPQAKNTIAAGDIAYIGTSAGDSVAQTTVDASSSYDCALGMSYDDGSNSGTASAPKALVAYPGATATVGVDSGIERGILVPGISGSYDYWVIAGFTLRGEDEAIDLEGECNGWRIIGNDISCPNGTGETGCVTGNPTNLAFYGNVVHDAAANVTTITKYYHAVYFGSDQLDLGWNVVENGLTCRAIQFHDTGGLNEYGLSVHDNLIHGTVCDGINFATVDPSMGKVEAYNNVIYDVGLGPDPADGASDYAGIYVSGETDMGPDGMGAVQIYNNTLYNCGSRGNSDSGAFNNGGMSAALTMNLVDNLVYATSSESYLASDSAPGLVTGSNNLWYGGMGGAPSGLTAGVTANPMLVNPTGFDFHLLPGSPAIGKGIPTSALFDFDGNPRGMSFDIGAYEHTM